MKRSQKLVAAALSLVLLAALPMTVFATTSPSPTELFTGYPVTILDNTTPAVSMLGRTNDREVMCFVAAGGAEVGVMSYSDYRAAINQYQVVVKLEDGGTIGYPPGDYTDWHDWFADKFNAYRGLSAESRETAKALYKAETQELFRQEVIRLTNLERAKAGLPLLEAHDDVMEFAQTRAVEIVDLFSHTRPNGGSLTVNGWLVSENIGGGATPEAAVKSWMESEGHRANILNPSAYAIGVGAFQPSESGGYFCVQNFLW